MSYTRRQYELSLLRAQWWLTSAHTGHCQQRKIYHGTETSGGAELTPDEKLASAMATALRHVEIAREMSEALSAREEEQAALLERAKSHTPKIIFDAATDDPLREAVAQLSRDIAELRGVLRDLLPIVTRLSR